ncbi:MAG: SH3 domain-containing protein [Planctomycetes bacterium]|nr:SH3 domain-containing protein [Planctomycetota bacterium]
MKKNWHRGIWAALVALPLAGAAAAWAAEQLIVIEREAAIRKDKRSYSPKLAAAREGERVNLIRREEPWLRVEYKGVEGWMNATSVTDNPRVVLSSEAAASGVRATEQSAAGRGFTPEVEREYRKNNPNLEAAFKLLDQIEKKWVYPDETVLEFIRKGQLAEFAPGGEK